MSMAEIQAANAAIDGLLEAGDYSGAEVRAVRLQNWITGQFDVQRDNRSLGLEFDRVVGLVQNIRLLAAGRAGIQRSKITYARS